MKKKYKFGEMLLILREEYKDCKRILSQLDKCVSLENSDATFYFRGILGPHSDSSKQNIARIVLTVEKRYLELLKKFQYLKYNWYSRYLYRAHFNVVKEDNGLYNLAYSDIFTPVDGRKYIPKVEILDQNKFSVLVDELLSSDLMQLETGVFSVNHDSIHLDFDHGYIDTPLCKDSFLFWDGMDDVFRYSKSKYYSPFLLEEILSLEISAEDISPSWLQLLQKHENDFDSNLEFDVDIDDQNKKSIFQISDIENNKVVKLTKRY